MNILDDMGESKLSAKVFLKVNYSFKCLAQGHIGVSQWTRVSHSHTKSMCLIHCPITFWLH